MIYNNHYNPNQPRDKNGEWTDDATSIQERIKGLNINEDAKKKMLANIEASKDTTMYSKTMPKFKEHVESLEKVNDGKAVLQMRDGSTTSVTKSGNVYVVEKRRPKMAPTKDIIPKEKFEENFRHHI